MIIVPAVLAHNAEDCRAKLFHTALKGEVPFFHIDVLDGSMFNASCWSDPAIIGAWEGVPEIELHLMVQNPMLHAVAWKKQVPSFKRAIFHAESHRPIKTMIDDFKSMGVMPTLAINPETTIESIEKHLPHLDELLVMGVHPGASGQSFLGEQITAKVKRIHALYPALPLALDGGVSKMTIHGLHEAGIGRFVASSALWGNTDPKEALHELRECAMIRA